MKLNKPTFPRYTPLILWLTPPLIALIFLPLMVLPSDSSPAAGPCKGAPWQAMACLEIDKELILASDPKTQAVFGEYLDRPGDYMYLAAFQLFWHKNKTRAHIYGYWVWVENKGWVDFGPTTEVWLEGVFKEKGE